MDCTEPAFIAQHNLVYRPHSRHSYSSKTHVLYNYTVQYSVVMIFDIITFIKNFDSKVVIVTRKEITLCLSVLFSSFMHQSNKSLFEYKMFYTDIVILVLIDKTINGILDFELEFIDSPRSGTSNFLFGVGLRGGHFPFRSVIFILFNLLVHWDCENSNSLG